MSGAGDTDNAKAYRVNPQYPTGYLIGKHPHLKDIPASIRNNAILDVLKVKNSHGADHVRLRAWALNRTWSAP